MLVQTREDARLSWRGRTKVSLESRRDDSPFCRVSLRGTHGLSTSAAYLQFLLPETEARRGRNYPQHMRHPSLQLSASLVPPPPSFMTYHMVPDGTKTRDIPNFHLTSATFEFRHILVGSRAFVAFPVHQTHSTAPCEASIHTLLLR